MKDISLKMLQYSIKRIVLDYQNNLISNANKIFYYSYIDKMKMVYNYFEVIS